MDSTHVAICLFSSVSGPLSQLPRLLSEPPYTSYSFAIILDVMTTPPWEIASKWPAIVMKHRIIESVILLLALSVIVTLFFCTFILSSNLIMLMPKYAHLFFLCKDRRARSRQVLVAGSRFPHKIPAAFRIYFPTGDKGQGQNKCGFPKFCSKFLASCH